MRTVLVVALALSTGCSSSELALDCQGYFSFAGAFSGAVSDEPDGGCSGGGPQGWHGGSYSGDSGDVQIDVEFPDTNLYTAGGAAFPTTARATLIVNGEVFQTDDGIGDDLGGCTGDILGSRAVTGDSLFEGDLLVDFLVSCVPLESTDGDVIQLSQTSPSTFLFQLE